MRTVSRCNPNARAFSRMLIPSTITALRTRRYTSTLYIHRTIHGLNFKPMEAADGPICNRHLSATTRPRGPLYLRPLHSVLAASDGPTAEMELASARGDTENLEDWIALLRKPAPEMPELAVDRDISLRLLSNYASSVNHQQYHETEIPTVRVAACLIGIEGSGIGAAQQAAQASAQ